MRKVKIAIFTASLIIGLLFVKAFGFSLGFGFPSFRFWSCVQGSGIAKTEAREISEFEEVDVSGAIEVEIVAQKDFSVSVESDDNLLEYIKTEVSGNTLKIYSKKGFSAKTKTRVIVSMPELTSLDVSGASQVSAVDIKTESLNIETSGASKIELIGVVHEITIDASGASRVNAESLQASKASVDSSGASTVRVFANETLYAEASGASNVFYSGNAANISKRSSGASSVTHK